MTETEDRIAGDFERISRDNLRIVRGQQALHALLDDFIKTFLTSKPGPSNNARPQAIARANDRRHLLMKTVGRTMAVDTVPALQDLVSHGTN